MSHYQKICLGCDAVIDDPAAFHCSDCEGLLGFRYDYEGVSWDERFATSMWRYWRLLPLDGSGAVVTLNEGGTPLLRSRLYPDHQVYLKDELRNPTGSHKDRPLSVAINHALTVGAKVSFVVSTGSTGVSNAALASRAGLGSVVIVTAGTPPERVYPMLALGSRVIEVHGEVDTLVDEVITICREQELYLSSTSHASNPYQGEGNKTIAYEILEQLGHAPDWMVVTVGGGGTISGIWRGFKDLKALGKIDSLPRLVGVVPKNYNALEIAFERRLTSWNEVLALPFHALPPSILVKLAHAYPPDGMDALDAVRESAGFFASVSDEEALRALVRVGRQEGLYVEASTSACVPVIDAMIGSEIVRADETLVALMCGSGFRETFVTLDQAPLGKNTVTMDELATSLVRMGRG